MFQSHFQAKTALRQTAAFITRGWKDFINKMCLLRPFSPLPYAMFSTTLPTLASFSSPTILITSLLSWYDSPADDELAEQPDEEINQNSASHHPLFVDLCVSVCMYQLQEGIADGLSQPGINF